MAGVNVEKGNLLSLTGDLDVEEYTRKNGSKTKIVKVTILYQNYSLIGAKKENEEKFASSQECYFSEYNDYGILFYLKIVYFYVSNQLGVSDMSCICCISLQV